MTRAFDKTYRLIVEAIRDANSHGVRRLSAGLSYYLLFSLVPLLILVVMVGTLFTGRGDSQQAVVGAVQGLFGQEIGNVIEPIVSNGILNNVDIIAGLVAITFVIWGASRFIVHLSEAFEIIFGINGEGASKGLRDIVKKRARSIIYLIPLSALMLLVFFLSAVVPFLIEAISNLFPFFPKQVFFFIQFGSIFSIMLLVFASVYRFLSPVKLPWKSAFLGSAFASLILIVVQTLFSLYISFATGVSLYGALGSVFAFLIWTYWSAIGFLYGVEISRASMEYNRSIVNKIL